MPRRTRQAALFGPAAVAVHDNAHMPGQTGEVQPLPCPRLRVRLFSIPKCHKLIVSFYPYSLSDCLASACKKRSLHGHQFGFLLGGQLVDLLAALVGHLLHGLLALLQVVLGDLRLLLHGLELFHGVPTDVADGDLAALAVLLHLLGQLLPALLRQLGEDQTNDLTVVLGVDAQLGDQQRLLNALSRVPSQGWMTRVRGSGAEMEATWLMGVSVP